MGVGSTTKRGKSKRKGAMVGMMKEGGGG